MTTENTKTPDVCTECDTGILSFQALQGWLGGPIGSKGAMVEVSWVCGLQTDPEQPPYHGPLIEIRPGLHEIDPILKSLDVNFF